MSNTNQGSAIGEVGLKPRERDLIFTYSENISGLYTVSMNCIFTVLCKLLLCLLQFVCDFI